MEGLAYDSAVGQAHSASQAPGRASRASNRASFLQRLLFAADLISAGLGALITALILGDSIADAGIMAATLMASWTLLAFVCGLYNVSGLHDWASGLPDAPRAVVAALLLTWPTLGIAELVGVEHAVAFALIATFTTVTID